MPKLSQRIPRLQASPMREILAVITRSGMISFAGGLPSPASFPQRQFQAFPNPMLQYGASEAEMAAGMAIRGELLATGEQET